MDQKPKLTEKQYYVVFAFVTSLFMLWGIAITMGDGLNKHFQNVLGVTKSQSGLVQLSIFGAYFIMGIPAGLFMKKYGYKSGVLLGLALYALGAFLFVPAAESVSFGFFRIALFVLACGLATLETVAHPFIASLGSQKSSDQRVNFGQTFNGIGAVVGPLIVSTFIFSGDDNSQSAGMDKVKLVYIAIGCVITLVAIIFSFIKVDKNLTDPHVIATDTYAIAAEEKPSSKLIHQKHFVFAAVAQLFNVAAQGGTWAFFINYGHEVLGLSDAVATNYFSISMVLMMLGRIVGTALMRYVIAPHKLLTIFAGGSILMCVIIAQGLGWVSFTALLMLNFFFSIMFPTIFSLGLKDLGKHTEQGSSFIVMGVVGGAIFPYFMGKIANTDVAASYYLPIICYTVIFFFAFLYPKLNKNAA
ncbi:L-fucose:H+ symporter permease [Mucilaginibacter limnophilus]|uniref:L-fucose:H+ symporter permease n=1 Tax=Mucilaginibacter limnophilus TaxID=1932778 RepID=A0A437MYE8_9SPHI|nr:L-fucose:H+ symporter permease [Mucilaginibacter limnophilus]RVU02616.1 L-fucose:H+ symporter permease [Mucilaginibacter limnophilus]